VVQLVVVFWGDFPQEHVKADGVAYVAGDHLAGWLLAQRERLDQPQAAAVAAAIRDRLASAATTDQPAPSR